MSNSPYVTPSFQPSLSQPTLGYAAAHVPPSRTKQHLISAGLGIVLAGVILEACRQFILTQYPLNGQGPHLADPLTVLLVLAVLVGTEFYFATRSSMGNLVVGLLFVLVELLNIFTQNIRPLPWLSDQVYSPTGVVLHQQFFSPGKALLLAGFFLGAAWAMNRSRRAGTFDCRDAAQLRANDYLVGQTPVAPPSRRTQHVVSAIFYPLIFFCCTALLSNAHAIYTFAAPAPEADFTQMLLALLMATLILLATAGSSHSSLGLFTLGALALVFSYFFHSIHSYFDYEPKLVSTYFLFKSSGSEIFFLAGLFLTLGWAIARARKAGCAAEKALNTIS